MTATGPACDHCGLSKTSMIAMTPGRDGNEWFLCGSCWIEGRTPMKLGRIKTTEIADPHLYDALVSAAERTAGLIDMDKAKGKKPATKKRSPQ